MAHNKSGKSATERKRPPRPGEGRPTKYKEEYCQRIIAYFDRPPQQTVYKRTFYADGGVKSEEPIVLGEQLPTFQGFAHEIGVAVPTLLEWCDEHPEFSKAYARAKELQERIWLVNGMGGQYNAQFAQFFGKNCLGYKDKTEQDINANVALTDADKKLLDKVANRLK